MTATTTTRVFSTITSPQPAPKESMIPEKLPLIAKVVRFSFKYLAPFAPRYAGKKAWKLFQHPIRRAKHKRTDELLESAEHFQIVHNDHNIKVYSWGKGERVVLLAHGWESRGTAMRAFAPHLLDRGFRVVAFDAPAHGDSSGKINNPYLTSVAMEGVINFLGGVYAIIGHSFGGLSTSSMLTLVAPSVHIEKLVLVAAPSRAEIPFKSTQEFLGFNDQVLQHMYETAKIFTGFHPFEIDVRHLPEPNNVNEMLIVHDKKEEIVPYECALDYFNNWKKAYLQPVEGYGHLKILKTEPVLKRVAQFINNEL